MESPTSPTRFRSFIRSATPYIVHRSGISSAIATRYKGIGVVFMLHSIVDDAAFYPEALLRCPVGRLDLILRWLRNNGVEFVSLDGAVARLRAPRGRPFA